MAQAPYGTVVFIRTEYTDAAGNVTKSLGTGTLVGPNDVLTAEHVVHHSGMTLTHIEISPGFEPAAPTNNLEFDITEDASFIREGGWLQPIPGFGFDQGEFLVNYYGNAPLGEALGDSTSASDVAVIGLNRPLGETFGWLGMRPEADADAGNHTVGYPLYESGHQTVSYSSSGTPTLTENGNFDLRSYNPEIKPGYSGGPMLDANNNVIGVVSTNGAANRLDTEWDDVQSWINGNDAIITRFDAPLIGADDPIPMTDTSPDYFDLVITPTLPLIGPDDPMPMESTLPDLDGLVFEAPLIGPDDPVPMTNTGSDYFDLVSPSIPGSLGSASMVNTYTDWFSF